MTILLIVGLAALALLLARLVVDVHSDGYGSSPPPRSHEAWDAAGPDTFRRIGF